MVIVALGTDHDAPKFRVHEALITYHSKWFREQLSTMDLKEGSIQIVLENVE